MVLPALAIVAVAGIGAYVLQKSQAATTDNVVIIRRASMNLAKQNSLKQMRQDIVKVSKASDVIGFQEVEGSNGVKAVKELEATKEWNVWWPGGAANAVAIAWRTDFASTPRVEKFQLYGKRVTKAHDGEKNVTPNRYVVVASLIDKSVPAGFIFSNVNGHAISKAYTNNPERKPRWNLWADVVVDTNKRLAVEKGRFILGSADANRDKWNIPGVVEHYANHGTYGNKYYDVIWSAGNPKCSAGSTKRVATNSDHDSLVVSFTCQR